MISATVLVMANAAPYTAAQSSAGPPGLQIFALDVKAFLGKPDAVAKLREALLGFDLAPTILVYHWRYDSHEVFHSRERLIGYIENLPHHALENEAMLPQLRDFIGNVLKNYQEELTKSQRSGRTSSENDRRVEIFILARDIAIDRRELLLERSYNDACFAADSSYDIDAELKKDGLKISVRVIPPNDLAAPDWVMRALALALEMDPTGGDENRRLVGQSPLSCVQDLTAWTGAPAAMSGDCAWRDISDPRQAMKCPTRARAYSDAVATTPIVYVVVDSPDRSQPRQPARGASLEVAQSDRANRIAIAIEEPGAARIGQGSQWRAAPAGAPHGFERRAVFAEIVPAAGCRPGTDAAATFVLEGRRTPADTQTKRRSVRLEYALSACDPSAPAYAPLGLLSR